MRRAFLLSLRLHGRCLLEAFSKEGRTLAPLGTRRLAILFLAFPLYGLLQAMHWLGFLIDEILFRGYRRTPIKEPLFITGVPRSGTTFLHRVLARDTDQFTAMQTWEVFFAPSIAERYLIKGFSWIDKKIGRPGHRTLEAITQRLTGNFAHIHAVNLHAAEEDSLTLLGAGACFILIHVFPASRSLWQLGRFQEIPEEERGIRVTYYKRCLQKHLYWVGPRKRLLSKNATFGSWVPDLRRAFPDARYIFCMREPQAALSSQLSALRPGLKFFGTMGAADIVTLEFQTVFAHTYRVLHEEQQSFLIDHLVIIDQAHLKDNVEELLEKRLAQLSLTLTDSLKRSIKEAAEETLIHASEHTHTQLTDRSGPSEFKTLVSGLYAEILSHPHAMSHQPRRST